MLREDAPPALLPAPVSPSSLAVLEGGALLVTLDAEAVAATGTDAAGFLHGQLANDVNGLAVGAVNRSLLLNHKGHAMAEGSVLRRGRDDLLLVVDDGRADWVVDSLDRHIIFDQVKLERRPELALLTLQGSAAAAVLGAAPGAGRYLSLELGGVPVTAYPRRRSAAGGFDLVVERAAVAEVAAALVAAGASQGDAETLDEARVRGLVPSAAVDGGDGVLPQEVGLVDALSYRKGCYLGQEIMARIEARGNLRRSLARLALDAEPDIADDRSVKLDGRTVGRLGTVVRFEGTGAGGVEALAVVRSDLPADAPLEVGGVRARVLERSA